MSNLLEIAIEAALKAGKDILGVYRGADMGLEMKPDDSPLTLADTKSHNRIVSYLEETSIPILSEEGQHIAFEERQNWEQLWIVDPLDGTKEFIKRNGEFTVNIALVEKGIPVLGVVYVPVQNVLYYASVDLGSFMWQGAQGEDFGISKAERLPLKLKKDRYTVVASRSHLSDETKAYIESIDEEVELISSGSSLKICLIAEGRADVYPRFAPTMEWDTAAGHAIALYAGKNIYKTDERNPIVYNKKDLLNPWFIVK